MRWLVLACVLAVACAGNFKKNYDSDFLFEEDDWKQKKEKPASTKTWIWDPENGLCSALECRSDEMCLLEDAYSAVCVSRDDIKQRGDRIVSRQLAEDEHIIKSQPWMTENDDDIDDDEYDDEIDLDEEGDDGFDDEDDDDDYVYDDDDEEDDDDEGTGDVEIKNTRKEVECRECPYTHPSTSTYICGTDNRTYSSLCRLEQHNCVHQTFVTTDCKGFCPCKESGSYRKRKQMLRDRITKSDNRYKSAYSKDKLKKKYERYQQKQNDFNQAKFYPKSGYKAKSYSKCSSDGLAQMGTRLVDWFNVLKQTKSGDKFHVKHSKYYTTHFPEYCKPVVQWMFLHLDGDSDNQLSVQELYKIEKDQPERCLKSFIDHCDRNGDIFLTSREWCQCFDNVKQPCFEKRNTASGRLGAYYPSCDENGFFSATQCQGSHCWCVDAHGAELKGTRAIRGRTHCDGDTERPDFNLEDEDDEDNFILEGSGAGVGF